MLITIRGLTENSTSCGFTYRIEEEIASTLWTVQQSMSVPASRPTASRLTTSSLVNVPQDSIRLYKYVHVARACTDPDCFSQKPTSWVQDADGHDRCPSCPSDPLKGEITTEDVYLEDFETIREKATRNKNAIRNFLDMKGLRRDRTYRDASMSALMPRLLPKS
jgi:hypothetical protein